MTGLPFDRPVIYQNESKMNITGPIQSNLPPIQDSVDQFLKVNQRIAGEILHISNEQVVLAVNGIQIVAKMTSSEQLALLMDKRYAYFIVKDISNNQITLQIANPVQTETSQKAIVSSNNLGQAILEKFGIPADKGNLFIVQAALDHGIKITPELINDIKKALEPLAQWGSREANLAVAIKSAGLPLTQASLSLAQNAVKEIKTNFLVLYEQLEIALARPGISQKTYELLRSTQNILRDAIISSGNSNESIEKNLSGSIKNMGISLENDISKFLRPSLEKLQGNIFVSNGRDDELSTMNGVLFALANLHHELGSTTLGKLDSAIDNFIQGMRWMHFINVEPDHVLPKGQWTQFDLPITFNFQTANHIQPDEIHELQIRVAHDNNEEAGNLINSEYTRLIIQVDLDPENIIKVDLSIVSTLVGAEITATNEDICLIASEELGEFQTGLANLGYTLKTSKIELGNLKVEMNINKSEKVSNPVTSVDLGV
jgi:hypothetical protein